ncbi:hypothetical protein LPJ56_002421 [Coemansia sp. RSA 2599]|nr:hypothetical protein LPJ75_002103 [Coemansia sp. RSA 2598]KAJ1825959.1 hypothetical protein LPJ56_002421 [Coemansia sp. RSA 2599]
MSSRHHSPILTQQQQQLATPLLHQGAHHPQQPQQHQQQRATPVADQVAHSASNSAFQPGQPPVNGYASFSGPPSAAADVHGHSRSPSRMQSPGNRQPPQAPPSMHHRHSQNSEGDRRHMRDERQMGHISGAVSPANGASHKAFSRHGTSKGGNVTSGAIAQQPMSGRSESRAFFGGDKDGDVRMDDAQQSAFKTISSREEIGALAASAPSGSSMTAAAISLPQVTTPAPPQDMALSSSSTPALSGPTAAPIRLPPVQVGGAGSFSAPGAGTATSMALAADDASKSSTNGSLSLSASATKTESAAGSLSLASAITATDEDNEDSAINSLMSLSNVATAFTSRPQTSPLASASKPGPTSISAFSSTEKDASREEALGTRVAKDGSVASSNDSAPSNELAAAAASLKVSEDSASTNSLTAAAEGDKRLVEGGSRSGRITPLVTSGADASLDQQASSAASSSSTSFATANNGVAALVPSKRSLTATGSGDAVVSSGVLRTSATPDNAGTSSSGVQPSGDSAVADGTASGREDLANGSGSSDDAAGNAGGPRKRGRQESPMSPSSEKQQQQLQQQQLKDSGDASAPGAPAIAADEIEEGEEFEDGEVFDDDEASFGDNNGSKSRASEDMVMDSGKVKHE